MPRSPRCAVTFATLVAGLADYIGGAQATLRRTGLWDAMEREGAAVGRVDADLAGHGDRL